MAERVTIAPLTPERFADLETLFATNGTTRGCSCMFWRQTGRENEANWGRGNRDRLRALVEDGAPTGLLAYRGAEAIGWVSVAPREDHGRLERSPTLARVDDRPTWSVACFFVRADARSSGVARVLLDGAVAFAEAHGADLIEGYPETLPDGPTSDDEVYTGTLGLFEACGFSEVARRTPKRAIVRREI